MPACNDDAMACMWGDVVPDNFKEVSKTEKTPEKILEELMLEETETSKDISGKTPDTVMDQSPETPKGVSQKSPGKESPDVIVVPSPYDPARYPDNQLGLLSPSPATWAICFFFSYNKE